MVLVIMWIVVTGIIGISIGIYGVIYEVIGFMSGCIICRPCALFDPYIC